MMDVKISLKVETFNEGELIEKVKIQSESIETVEDLETLFVKYAQMMGFPYIIEVKCHNEYQ
jgi:hypothetical protein